MYTYIMIDKLLISILRRRDNLLHYSKMARIQAIKITKIINRMEEVVEVMQKLVMNRLLNSIIVLQK